MQTTLKKRKKKKENMAKWGEGSAVISPLSEKTRSINSGETGRKRSTSTNRTKRKGD